MFRFFLNMSQTFARVKKLTKYAEILHLKAIAIV